MRDVPERHRSMTATFDHSWRLLSRMQRSILRQLSVFRGGCTREAAEAVTGATLADLEELVDASWVRLDEKRRYELHELTRQYCAEKLETEHVRETGETPDQVHDRHAAYYRSLLLAQQHRLDLRPEAFAELATEYDNLLAAWNWFVATDDLDAVRTMTLGLGVLAFWRGWARIIVQRLEACMRQIRGSSVPRSS